MTKFSQKIKDEMNAAVLRGDAQRMKDFVLNADKKKVYALFKGHKKLYEAIYQIARDDKSANFEKILKKYSDDEMAVDAILRGFKADERYNNQPDFDDRFGPSKDHADLERKRKILMEALTGEKPRFPPMPEGPMREL